SLPLALSAIDESQSFESVARFRRQLPRFFKRCDGRIIVSFAVVVKIALGQGGFPKVGLQLSNFGNSIFRRFAQRSNVTSEIKVSESTHVCEPRPSNSKLRVKLYRFAEVLNSGEVITF